MIFQHVDTWSHLLPSKKAFSRSLTLLTGLTALVRPPGVHSKTSLALCLPLLGAWRGIGAKQFIRRIPMNRDFSLTECNGSIFPGPESLGMELKSFYDLVGNILIRFIEVGEDAVDRAIKVRTFRNPYAGVGPDTTLQSPPAPGSGPIFRLSLELEPFQDQSPLLNAKQPSIYNNEKLHLSHLTLGCIDI